MYKLSLFLLLCFSFLTENIFAQKPIEVPSTQSQLWEKFQELREKGLAKDEVKFLDSVLVISVKQKNAIDFYIALSNYGKSVRSSLKEKDEKYRVLENFERLSIQLKAPFSNMLHAFLADQYHNSQYMWNLYGYDGDYEIKSIVDGKEVVFSNTNRFLQNKVILNHYRQSIISDSNFTMLELKDFKKEQTAVYYAEKPHLIDYYANEYINYLKRELDNTYSNSSHQELINLFGSSENITSVYSDEALKVFSQMELFNLEKREVYAYINWRLQRMAYVNTVLTPDDKFVVTDAYIKAIALFKVEVNQQFKNHPAILALILRASEVIASDERNQYNWKKNPAAKNQKRQEYDLISKGLSDYSTSLYADIAESKLTYIRATTMTLAYENQNLSSKSSLLTVNYKNISKAYLAVFHVDSYKKEEFKHNRLKQMNLTSFYEQALILDSNGEYNMHSKDFIIPALKKTGKYLIVIADTKERLYATLGMYSVSSDISFAYAEIDFTNLAASTKIEDDQITWLIQDKKSGLPIAGVSIFIKEYTGRPIVESNILIGKTDSKGVFKMTSKKQLNWTALHKGDSITGYAYIYNNSSAIKKLEVKTKIITERGIYRPGQKVYFKLYAFEGESPNFKVAEKYETTLFIEDENGTEFGQIDVVTNEFGTFSGSFELPRKGFLPGRFLITDYNEDSNYDSETTFLVEEYKRPTFEVKSDFEKKIYQLNDEVKVNGNVKAFAGFGLNDVKLSVRVEASSTTWRSYRTVYTDILDTIITSNSQGEFSFSFLAKNQDYNYGSVFSYTIEATTLAGETQEVSNRIFIGKTNPEWVVNLPSVVLSTNNSKGVVSSANSTDASELVTLELWKSKPISKSIFRFYQPKEFHDFNEKEFNKQFVNSIYGEKLDYLNYQKVKSITVHSLDSIDINTLTDEIAGTYQVRIVQKENDISKTKEEGIDAGVKTFIYISAKSKKNQHNSELWVQPTISNAKVGDEMSFIIGSSFKKINAVIELYRGSKLILQKNEKIIGRKTINYKLQYDDLGGITMLVRTVVNGNFISAQSDVDVSFEELKSLRVKLETERTILRPGQKEIWTMKVSTKDGTPLSSEGVATLTDASLRAFSRNYWNLDIYKKHYFSNRWSVENDNPNLYFRVGVNWNERFAYEPNVDGIKVKLNKSSLTSDVLELHVPYYGQPLIMKDGGASGTTISSNASANVPEAPRTNMDETAFFYPTLYSNSDNEFKFEFTLPDALTSWDFQALVHDKTMRYGTYFETFIAQKELMIQPNAPRFFRAGDEVEFASNAINLTDKAQDVTVSLEWFDPFTNEILPDVFGKLENQTLILKAKENQAIFWKLRIPKSGLDLVAYRIRVSSDKFADAEEKVIPVLSNRAQVIESVPVTIETKGTYTFDLPKLSNPTSKTQINQSLTLEYNSNPIWSVVMAVPYVMEQQIESADQIFNTYFINQLSQRIIEKNPAIEQVLRLAGENNPDLFLSALYKNPELKDIILSETPWILEANSESAQKKRISELFNSNNLEMQEQQLLTRLELLKNSDGGWSWFGNDKSNVYITQYILSGFAYLKTIGIDYEYYGQSMSFLENNYAEQYAKLNKDQLKELQGLSSTEIQWLYIRSLWNLESNKVSDYYTACLKKDWTKHSLQVQAMAGVYFLNTGQRENADLILKSILNSKTTKKNLGTFWNQSSSYYSWDRSSVETQAVLIDFFNRMKVDVEIVNSMKVWLLNQKRGQAWESSKATSLACYAMLVGDKPVSNISQVPNLKVGNKEIDASSAAKNLGYVKQTWSASEIDASMGSLTVAQKEDEPAFGSLTLVYTDEISKIQKNNTGLIIDKKMYLIQNGKEVLITPQTELKLGDLVRVRLQVETDQALEFVHIKDTKASGSENIETLSGHKSAGNMYYYQVVHDASTDFFLDYLARGKHHLTYDMRISGKGLQSTGYATVECMYAPEFRANTSSGLIDVK